MTGKKVSFGKPPTSTSAGVEAWVKKREMDKETTKRLTIDVSEETHRRLKSECAMRGKNMRDVVTQLIEDALAQTRNGKS
jgi:macrodomain Ter protein organizer (MatP/YcbG family)